jgi:SAM-dependent methyltransferase
VRQQPFYENPGIIGSSTLLPRSRIALEFASQLRVADILDYGCGDGEVTHELARATGAAVVGADVSQVAVDACRRGLRTEKLEFGRSLPFGDRSFDLVFMAEVIEHLVDPAGALEEVRRILRPHGYLILSAPNLACLPNRLLLMIGVQPLFSEVSEEHIHGRWLRTFGQGGQPVGHLRLYTKRALQEFISSSGFQVLRMRGPAFHEAGLTGAVESAIANVAGLAMIFVVLARLP